MYTQIFISGFRLNIATKKIATRLAPTMTTLHRNFEQTYRCVVSLNNHGIILLERECYEQGLATLRDAMDTMRTLFIAWETSSICRVDIQQYLQDCFLRLANPTAASHAHGICIHTLTNDIFDHQTAFPTENVRQVVLNPIRIDDLSFDTTKLLSDDFEMTAATVLHNFAIASWLTSKTISAAVPATTAFRLLEMSNQILDKLEQSCKDELELRKIACVNVAVIWTLVKLLELERKSNKENCRELLEAYSKLTERLVDLQSTVQYIDEIFSYWTGALTIAPAA